MAALLHGLVVSPALAAVQISGWKSSQRPPSAVAAGGARRPIHWRWGPMLEAAARHRRASDLHREGLPRGLDHDLSPSRRCGARRRGVFREKSIAPDAIAVYAD